MAPAHVLPRRCPDFVQCRHGIFQTAVVQTWAAVFVSIVLQSLPFLTLVSCCPP